MYVELISPKDSLVARQKLHLISGIAWSDIALPVSLKQGDYRIMAYTNWMRNAGPDNFYDQRIRIGGIYPFIGYYKAKAFYTPKYTPKSGAHAGDMRPTIYWNPNILTDKYGKASIEYFNNDTKGVYRVVIEGIDDNGNLGRQVYRYKVE